MAKIQRKYVCQQCGAQYSQWMGKCPTCDTWDSLLEQIEQRGPTARSGKTTTAITKPTLLQDIATTDFARLPVPGSELAQVLGGGLVPGSMVLIGGDPGIGKTTLLTQVAAHFATHTGIALYVSAEESPQQIKLRTQRLGLHPDKLYISPETCLDSILQDIQQLTPRLVVIDSIQTVYLEDITSAAGSVSQVRECTLRLMRMAKELHIPMFLVGHVTKEGTIAGPRVLEHIVDTVLYLEGERFHQYRLLRGVKNRFGSTNEVGVFEMTRDGMQEVANPSQVFIAERNAGAPGSTITVALEGTRPLMVEVQALTSHTGSAQPRRTANGFDLNRLLMLVAVLSKRVGLPLFNQDIYVNIVGGLRISEPAADLAVAMAIASSFRNQRIDPELVLVGEIGLSGELRSVSQLERRLGEAARLGFSRAITPQAATKGADTPSHSGLIVQTVRSLADAVGYALIRGEDAENTTPKRPKTPSKDTGESHIE
jgi:DNA repair protein RadA/Sms